MRIVVTGATGNVGTSVLPALADDPAVDWAVSAAGVGAVVMASSVGVYSPGPKDRRVDESWPRQGVPTSVRRGLRPGRRPPVRGAFNLAAEPVLDGEGVARILGARPVPVPRPVLRAAAALSWRLHLQPNDPGWVDLVFSAPLMDTGRIRRELGWQPRYDAADAAAEILEGFRDRAGLDTAPLMPVG